MIDYPPYISIKRFGDLGECDKYIKPALSQLAKLERQMELGNSMIPGGVIDAPMRRIPAPGIMIECFSGIGGRRIKIYANPIKGKDDDDIKPIVIEEITRRERISYNLQLIYFDPDLEDQGAKAFGMSPKGGIVAVNRDTIPADNKYSLFGRISPLFSHLLTASTGQVVYKYGSVSMALFQAEEGVLNDLGELEWWHHIRVTPIVGGADYVFRQKRENSTMAAALSTDLNTLYIIYTSALYGGVLWTIYKLNDNVWEFDDSGFIDNLEDTDKERIGNIAISRDGEISAWTTYGDSNNLTDRNYIENESEPCDSGGSCYSYQEEITYYGIDQYFFVYNVNTSSFVPSTEGYSKGQVVSVVNRDYGISRLKSVVDGVDLTYYSLTSTAYYKSGTCSCGDTVSTHEYVEGAFYVINDHAAYTSIKCKSGTIESFGVVFPGLSSYADNNSLHYADIDCIGNYGILTYHDIKDEGGKSIRETYTRTSLLIETIYSSEYLDTGEYVYDSGPGDHFIGHCLGGLWGGQPGLVGAVTSGSYKDIRHPIKVYDVYELADAFITSHNELNLSFYGIKYRKNEIDDLTWKIYCDYNGMETDITADIRAGVQAIIDIGQDYLQDAVDLIMDNITTIIFIPDTVLEETEVTEEV